LASLPYELPSQVCKRGALRVRRGGSPLAGAITEHHVETSGACNFMRINVARTQRFSASADAYTYTLDRPAWASAIPGNSIGLLTGPNSPACQDSPTPSHCEAGACSPSPLPLRATQSWTLKSSLRMLTSSTQNAAMITIYHNPRCSKSRGACELIASTYNVANEPVEIVEYLKHALSVAELKSLNAMLDCPVREMLRDTEPVYKELGPDDAELSDDQLYEAIEKHPILMQRPIVVRNGRAVIGRPPENVKVLFD
jgi:arsenate reductase